MLNLKIDRIWSHSEFATHIDEDWRDYFIKTRAKELKIALLKLQREAEEEERAAARALEVSARRAATKTSLPIPNA